tara:strand:- start:207 stop:371 length:165 start_codon:yes stop_codon:yes gene_type:complete
LYRRRAVHARFVILVQLLCLFPQGGNVPAQPRHQRVLNESAAAGGQPGAPQARF